MKTKAILIYLILIALAATCSAATIIVDVNGDGHFETIQAAIDSASDGDIIIVQPGLYLEIAPPGTPRRINFLGKNITLTSTNPTNPDIVLATRIGGERKFQVDVFFSGSEEPNCVFTGFNVSGHVFGSYRPSPFNTHATISHCLFYGSCGSIIVRCDGTINNCVIADNNDPSCVYNLEPRAAISECRGLIKNCTIVNNRSYGIGLIYYPGEVTIENCIIYNNGWYPNGPQIWLGNRASLNIRYCDLRGGIGTIVGDGIVNWGPGNIDADPCFVRLGYWEYDESNWILVEGDYHLLPNSPCINAGDPNYIADPNETDLDGQPRIFLGRVDIGVDEFVPSLEVPMHFTPRTLNPKSKGKWIKAHLVLPEGFSVEDVNTNNPARIVEPFMADSNYIDVFINEDGLVKIMAAFDRADFCSNGSGHRNVVVIGRLTNGQYFYGTDTIRIKTNNLEYLAVLTSYWLAAGCVEPDWCAGADLNRDSVVDFIDFALFGGCCLEFIKK